MGIEGAVKRVLSEAALGLYLPGRSPTTRFWSRFRFAVTLRSVGASVLLAETLWAGEHQINLLVPSLPAWDFPSTVQVASQRSQTGFVPITT
jgi:hypothetical protein